MAPTKDKEPERTRLGKAPTPAMGGERLAGVKVRPMVAADLAEARRIFQLAFGTFLGLPDPASFAADRDFTARWHADPDSGLAAELDGRLIGSNFLTRWGSFGFFGPLTVLPEYWDCSVAQALLGPTVERFQSWGVRDVALFTFAHSPKHVALYQKFGFWPGSQTALLSAPAAPRQVVNAVAFSSLDAAAQAEALAACAAVTGAILDGLNVGREIEAIAAQQLGDTLLLWATGGLEAFACCHCGAGTEAGAGNLYIKFAGLRPGPGAPQAFDRLLDAAHQLAAARGLKRVETGVSLARRRAWVQLLARGFRISMLGVSMHRPDTPAYNRPDVFALDDWR
ncbi:MAG: GNAT family N-acetyltransferase [Terriglobales bacterium]